MVAGLALTAAFFYGAADFLGGLASRRTPPLRVLLVSAPVGVLPLLVFALRDPWPTWTELAYGIGSGTGAAAGLLLLYRALSVGRMNVVAPVSAAVAAVVPVLAGLALGERPTAAALLGVVLALAAVAAVSRSPGDPPAGPDGAGAAPLLLSAAAGIGFGMFFVLLYPVRHDGVAPLLVVRLTTCLIVLLVATVTRQLVLPPWQLWPAAVVAGLLEATAHLCYLTAVGRGMLALVAVLSSLYPASTVLLARVLLRERFASTQVLGLGLAVVGITLIGLAT